MLKVKNARLPTTRTDQVGRVNSDYQAGSSSNKAKLLYGDHGHTPSPQSRSAFWIYEALQKRVCPLTKVLISRYRNVILRQNR